ncbi:MAG: phage terminase large subunit family protein [Desulfobacteraceae bacterium]|nr:phage terminase large subunit family protein [Desulfobacteraceae bacterium]
MTETAQQTLFDPDDGSGGAGFLPGPEIRTGVPDWMPADICDAIRARGNEYYPVRFSRAEKKILRKRKKIAVSAWAEKHRHVTMSSIEGPWRNEVTPYLPGIMDAAQFSSVRVIAVRKCPQSGVTEAVHNFVGAAIDQDPGPVLYVFPDQEMAEENSRDRILPMIKASRRLKGYLSGTRKDESLMRINLAHMPIYLGWATSPSRLGNKPIRYGIADECAKYRSRGSRETGAIQLIDKRFTTYRDTYKFWKISTPVSEDDAICKAADEAEVLFHYWVRCPVCTRDQLMRFDRIKFLEGCRDANEMLRRNLARYECEHCGAHWDDHLRNRAVALGQWRAQGHDEPLGLELNAYLAAHRPINIAFQLPAWITRFNSLAYCASVFLESLSGDLDKKKDFRTQIEAMPYKQVVREPVATEYKAAVCDLPAQTVPAEAVALTCGIDCQKVGFYFVVRAWARDYSSWLVHYGKLGTWEDIEALLFDTTYPAAGSSRRMAIARAAIDTGGGKFGEFSMFEEACFWIRKNGAGRGARVWGVQGASWPQPHRIKVSKPFDKTPQGKPLPGGLQILTLDTERFKDAFFHRLGQAAAREPELCAWLHADTGDEYFAHITAEHKVEDDKGVLSWQKKGSRRNDWLDCEVYAAAAADPEWPHGGIHLMVAPGSGADTGAKKTPGKTGRTGQSAPDQAPGGYDLPSWIRQYS